jgi:hypothetical protein
VSTKARSDALRKLLAETIEQSAATPAPLTVTGVGAGPEAPGSPREENSDEVPTPDSGLTLVEKELVSPPAVTADGDLPIAEVMQPERALAQDYLTAPAVRRPNESALPSAPIAPPASIGEKLSVFLGPRDLAILERFHEDARGAGIKMRKGGNPSLFVRAALRLLDDVGSRNADDWAQIVASTLRDAR